jgi:hypothetical protein
MPSIPRAVRSGAIFTAIGVYLPCRSASAFCSAFNLPSKAGSASPTGSSRSPLVFGDETLTVTYDARRIDRAQARDVVVRGARVRRVEVLADIKTEDAVPRRVRHVVQEPLDAVVVEPEPIDEGLGLRHAKETRPWVARVAGAGSRCRIR